MLATKSDTHFERIFASYDPNSKLKLTPFEDEAKTRWESAYNMLLNTPNKFKVVGMLKEMYDVSIATAYRDIAAAKSLYGDMSKASKEGERQLLIIQTQQLIELAYKEKNLELINKCQDRLYKLFGLDQEDAPFNVEKLASMKIEITMPNEFVKAISEVTKKGVVDFNNLDTSDIPFEEVPNNSSTV